MRVDFQNRPLFTVMDLLENDNVVTGDPHGFDATERAALRITAEWTHSYLGMPHPKRKGTMCPFSPSAVDRGRIWLGVDRRQLWREEILAETLPILVDYADRFFRARPADDPDADYDAVVVAFPDQDWEGVATRLKGRLAADFHDLRRMIGYLDICWDGGSIEEIAQGLVRSPMGVLILRRMVRGDDFFLVSPESRARYERHFPR
jgi:hypothetical protein